MTRYELLCAVEQLSKLLDDCGLKEALKRVVKGENDGEEAGATPSVIETYQAFSSRSRRFGVAERRTLKALKLGFLQHTDFWVQFLQSRLTPEMARNVLERIYFAQKYLPGLVDLLKNETEVELEKPTAERDRDLLGKELLTVLILHPEERVPTVVEVQELMTAVEGFYDACAMMTGAEPELSYLGTEICEGARMQFIGADEPVSLIKQSILAIWDRRHSLLDNPNGFCADDQTLDIPAFSQLRDKVGSGVIGEQRGEQIHHRLCEAFEQFLRVGARIAELDGTADEDSDLLMTLRELEDEEPTRPNVVAMHGAARRGLGSSVLASDERFSAWESERDMLLRLVEERRA